MTAEKRERGRPSLATDVTEPSSSLRKTADERRRVFEQLTPAQQLAERRRILSILQREKRQKRAKLSPLARIAWRAYGLRPDWISPSEMLEREIEL